MTPDDYKAALEYLTKRAADAATNNTPVHVARCYVNTIKSALALAMQAGWRDISDAPRDGTHILVCIAGCEFNPVTVCWNQGGWEKHFEIYSKTHHMLDKTPTHWMPLPAPPLDQPSGGGDAV